MKQSIHAIANNLRKIREERNLSLDQLAERTGVSKSMLRKIELGTSSPTISTIWKIANGLRVSFTSLLRNPVIQAEVRSFKGEPPLTGENEHYRVYLLVPFDPEQPFETFYIEIDPDTVFDGTPHEGNVYEYVYVTEGELLITVDGKEFQVKEKEFIQFYANCPHKYECLSPQMASVIMKISYVS
ncbi:MAG: XRE family transcriptional regulator [Desulforhopalus sp.]